MNRGMQWPLLLTLIGLLKVGIGNEMTSPEVVIIQTVQKAYEGDDSIKLTCEVSGNPLPIFSWYKGLSQHFSESVTLSVLWNRSTLDFQNVTVEDTGEYRCIASNPVGRTERSAYITVYERLKILPKEPAIYMGQSAVVICTGTPTTKIPPGSIEWVRADGSEFLSNMRDENGVLVIDSAVYENSGEYICRAPIHNIGPVHIVLSVSSNDAPSLEKEPEVKVSTDWLQIPAGGTGTVECSPQGNPLPRIRWRKHFGHFREGTSQRKNTLIITNAQEADQGYYSCEGIVDGIPVHNAYILVNVEPREPPNVQIWPSAIPHFVTFGSRYDLYCRVQGGVPEPTVTWDRNGGRALSSHVEITKHNVLRFNPVAMDDEGEYTCTASNAAGTTNATTLMKVVVLPEINITSVYTEVNVGAPVSVECRAQGHPEPKVSIRDPHNSEIVGASIGKAVLKIPSAFKESGGEYICIAYSSAGYAEQRFVIQVNTGDSENVSDGRTVNTDVDVREPPGVQIWSSGVSHIQVFTVGGQYELQCRIQANVPESNVTWERNAGQALSPNVQRKKNNILRFQKVELYDEGMYTCTAFNSDGKNQSATALIKVVSTPNITILPSLNTRVNVGDSVNVQCLAEGYPDPEVTIRDQDNNEIDKSSSKLAILNISSASFENNGEYICSAKSFAGIDEKRFTIQVLEGDSSTERNGNFSTGVAEGSGEEVKNAQYTPDENTSQLFAIEGQKTILHCKASPEQGVTWRKDNKPLHPLQSNADKIDTDLIIRNVTKADAGQYVCSLINRMTQVAESEIYYRLEVIALPSIELIPTKQVVRPGESLSVECVAQGDDVEVTWILPNGSTSSRIEINDNILKLREIQIEDAGEYICSARNVLGNTNAVAEVVVSGVVPA